MPGQLDKEKTVGSSPHGFLSFFQKKHKGRERCLHDAHGLVFQQSLFKEEL